MRNESRFPGFVDALLDGDGRPPCDPPDTCTVCRLLDHQRPDETRQAWLARITGGLVEGTGRRKGKE